MLGVKDQYSNQLFNTLGSDISDIYYDGMKRLLLTNNDN